MFSNKENVNILTRLLLEHGVNLAVVCPGSRNAPIVHNFSESNMKCVPVTDERSAGFYALGMALSANAPVAVCVTSGSALLNLAPAVAEAYYRHVPLIVISADRPQSWIGQLDGQTLPQPGVFGGLVGNSITLPEPMNEEARWYCSRLVNEALLVNRRKLPVHINVPISEPLFEFTVDKLPEVCPVGLLRPAVLSDSDMRLLADRFCRAKWPMIVIGQMDNDDKLAESLKRLSTFGVVVLHEPLCPGNDAAHFDEVLFSITEYQDYAPDFILYAGDTVVSKRLKNFLRRIKDVETWTISQDGAIHDTFMSQTYVVEAEPYNVLSRLLTIIEQKGISEDTDSASFRASWSAALAVAEQYALTYEPCYSQMMAVKLFESMLDDVDYDFCVHYANSSVVRLANIYAHHYIYVNRGVNGIEGSLSTAAGFSIMCGKMTFCVIGDLSFFYDNNALWNQNLSGNLRVLLLNNCCGGIFHQLPGLNASPVRDNWIAAGHHASAHGICDAHDIGYLSAHNPDELNRHMKTFLYSGTHRPLVFEVFTDAEEDANAVKRYYEAFSPGSKSFP